MCEADFKSNMQLSYHLSIIKKLFGVKHKPTIILMINLIMKTLGFKVSADMGICAIDEIDKMSTFDNLAEPDC
jgi:hypothetical protein